MEEFSTIIGASTKFKGKVNLESNIRIEGQYEGEIVSTADIVVGRSGFLTGTVSCKSLIVYGIAQGKADCYDTFAVIPGGKYEGDILARNISMDKDSMFEGSIKMKR